ncbi:hypothetical protein BOTBODRAFT_37499 [Botryobasidium botryosum FD-172 SS1]|uniref:Uncharacterized protein n=1 Tax=Botryobasidium botryosum (strain FD-172 SS1) TaxID=930990 RepID=A0A067MAS8_BOTB1|nr:hypothetical protein BOTBODRAFT_37499 [Botryobasidium botryosum FD-172 SS1]
MAEIIEIKRGMLKSVREALTTWGSDVEPVTWEEVDDYLRKEVIKPVGQRDLRK